MPNKSDLLEHLIATDEADQDFQYKAQSIQAKNQLNTTLELTKLRREREKQDRKLALGAMRKGEAELAAQERAKQKPGGVAKAPSAAPPVIANPGAGQVSSSQIGVTKTGAPGGGGPQQGGGLQPTNIQAPVAAPAGQVGTRSIVRRPERVGGLKLGPIGLNFIKDRETVTDTFEKDVELEGLKSRELADVLATNNPEVIGRKLTELGQEFGESAEEFLRPMVNKAVALNEEAERTFQRELPDLADKRATEYRQNTAWGREYEIARRRGDYDKLAQMTAGLPPTVTRQAAEAEARRAKAAAEAAESDAKLRAKTLEDDIRRAKALAVSAQTEADVGQSTAADRIATAGANRVFAETGARVAKATEVPTIEQSFANADTAAANAGLARVNEEVAVNTQEAREREIEASSETAVAQLNDLQDNQETRKRILEAEARKQESEADFFEATAPARKEQTQAEATLAAEVAKEKIAGLRSELENTPLAEQLIPGIMNVTALERWSAKQGTGGAAPAAVMSQRIQEAFDPGTGAVRAGWEPLAEQVMVDHVNRGQLLVLGIPRDVTLDIGELSFFGNRSEGKTDFGNVTVDLETLSRYAGIALSEGGNPGQVARAQRELEKLGLVKFMRESQAKKANLVDKTDAEIEALHRGPDGTSHPVMYFAHEFDLNDRNRLNTQFLEAHLIREGILPQVYKQAVQKHTERGARKFATPQETAPAPTQTRPPRIPQPPSNRPKSIAEVRAERKAERERKLTAAGLVQ